MSESLASATYFPLRWESTGDKWWYASPIDCAAANGHYDLVQELIRLDANHLISLTSLRRLRRLESVWDDAGDSHFSGAAKARSAVARTLLQDSKIFISGNKKSPLIGAGFGGWLLYTAASAGDLDFVRELLGGDPLLVFGEGEYGLTDMLYAAARSRNPEVFWSLYDFAASPRFDGAERGVEVPSGFKWEVVNRAVHAAARGGNSEVLSELLGASGEGVLTYRDAYGSTVLHASAARGQVEVVKYLIETYDGIISSTDNEGNTALHIAAYKGQRPVLEALLLSSPSSIKATNNNDNTLLHMAVAGALSPGFRRLDCQIKLTEKLLTAPNFNIESIINAKNKKGLTALHNAVIGNVHPDLVQLLMSARYVNVNIRDDNMMTPLDYLRRRPRSASSKMLIRQLMLAGGMSNCQDYSTRKAMASRLKMQGAMCSSPGTSFGVMDLDIFKYSEMEHVLSGSRTDQETKISRCGSNGGDHEEQANFESKKRGVTVECAAKKLKTMLCQWSKMTSRKFDNEAPVSLRERFLGHTTGNKRSLAVRSNISSPRNRKKLASTHGDAASSSNSKVSGSSHVAGGSFSVRDRGDETPSWVYSKKRYLCFGGSRLSLKNSIGRRNKQPIRTAACH